MYQVLILKLKYISENNKKQCPSIPKELKEYIYLNEDNEIEEYDYNRH